MLDGLIDAVIDGQRRSRQGYLAAVLWRAETITVRTAGEGIASAAMGVPARVYLVCA